MEQVAFKKAGTETLLALWWQAREFVVRAKNRETEAKTGGITYPLPMDAAVHFDNAIHLIASRPILEEY